VLLGKGGSDQLFGGLDNDTLTGGDADDQMFGEDGNDRWSGIRATTATSLRAASAATLPRSMAATAPRCSPHRQRHAVRFDRSTRRPSARHRHDRNPRPQRQWRRRLDQHVGQRRRPDLAHPGRRAGNDTILGGNGIDTILGGDGIDFVDANQGNDVVFLGAGNDTFQWDPGDGSDIIEGQAGTDQIIFNGNGAAESFDVSANGGRSRIFRDVGSITLDADDVESLTLNAGGGTDNVVINDISSTDLTQIVVNLAGTIGGSTGDAQVDFVSVVGGNTGEVIDVVGAGTALAVTGGPAFVGINQVEFTDRLNVFGGAGNDVINASTLASGIVILALDGGLNDDDIRAAPARSIVRRRRQRPGRRQSGPRQRLPRRRQRPLQLGPWRCQRRRRGPVRHRRAPLQRLQRQREYRHLANGGRRCSPRRRRHHHGHGRHRDDPVPGARRRRQYHIADMTGTDVTQVIVDLAASGGGGDSQVDRVTVQATNVADIVTVTNGSVNVDGLAAADADRE
jgi:Ca2+-binding RTX toxin-like protein